MAKADKNNKKAASKKAEQIKAKPAVPAKEVLAKAETLAKTTSKKAQAKGKKTSSASSDDSSDSSSAEESSSAESDSSEQVSPPVKSTPASVKKTAKSSDDSSDASSSEGSSSEKSGTSNKGKVSGLTKTTPTPVQKAAHSSGGSSDASSSEESSSEDSDDDKEMASVLAKTSPDKGKKTSDSEDDSSDTSDSEESSSESDSDEDKTSAPAQTAPPEANKKRKADGESVALPKKAKLANHSANAVTSGEEIKSIFVGQLSWNVDNDWLAQEFAECGEVESAHVQMDRNTGRSRGFGYVHFKTADALENALAMNGREIDGRAVKIDRSSPRDKKVSTEKRAQTFGDVLSPPSAVLFVGNLSFGVNEDTLWEAFGEHGDVKSVRLPTDRDTGKPKGFAYVEFSEVGAAKKARGALEGFELDGRAIRLDFSRPRDGAGGRGGGQGNPWGSRGGRGRGGFVGDRGRGGGRGGRPGDRGGRGRGRGARTGGITQFEGRKITFD